jgi:hypothetical protein
MNAKETLLEYQNFSNDKLQALNYKLVKNKDRGK